MLLVRIEFLSSETLTGLLKILSSVKTMGALYSSVFISRGLNTLNPDIPPKSNSPFFVLSAAP